VQRSVLVAGHRPVQRADHRASGHHAAAGRRRAAPRARARRQCRVPHAGPVAVRHVTEGHAAVDQRRLGRVMVVGEAGRVTAAGRDGRVRAVDVGRGGGGHCRQRRPGSRESAVRGRLVDAARRRSAARHGRRGRGTARQRVHVLAERGQLHVLHVVQGPVVAGRALALRHPVPDAVPPRRTGARRALPATAAARLGPACLVGRAAAAAARLLTEGELEQNGDEDRNRAETQPDHHVQNELLLVVYTVKPRHC